MSLGWGPAARSAEVTALSSDAMDARSSSPCGLSTTAAAPPGVSIVRWVMPEITTDGFAAGPAQTKRGITLSLISSSDEMT